MKTIFLLLALLTVHVGRAQEEQWTKISELKLAENAVWHCDRIGNIYLSDKDQISKLDTNGRLLYSQSSKSFGRISKIESINALKIVLFSEDQQLIAITDNTLTDFNDVINLNELDFGYISLIATSEQANKLWIIDQINSKITLFDFSNSQQSQEVENLRGLLKSKEIVFMQEIGGRLFLCDSENKLFIMDRYGSLIDVHNLERAEYFYILGTTVILVGDNRIEEYDLLTKTKRPISLPMNDFKKVQWRAPNMYFEQSQTLLKYNRK